jgi:hypothetical protein
VKVYQQKYSSKRFNRSWKVYAKKCYRYMLKVAKGSLCAICDIEEHSRFSNSDFFTQPATPTQTAAQRLLQAVQNKQAIYQKGTTNAYLSPADAFAFSNNCADYIEEHVYLLEHLRLFRKVLKYKSTLYEKQEGVEFPNLPTAKKMRDTIDAMRKCANDSSECTNNKIVEDFFDINLGTRFERIYYETITKMAIHVDKSFNDRYFWAKDSNDFRSVEAPIGDASTTPNSPGRILTMTLTQNARAMSQFFMKESLHNEKPRTGDLLKKDIIPIPSVKFTIDGKYKKMLSTMDESMPTMDLMQFALFQRGRSCPMAPMFGGVVSLTNISRKNATMCPTVTNSCCTESSFVTFESDWKIGQILLTKKYESWSALTSFLLNDLVNTDEKKKSKYFRVLPDDPDAEGCQGTIKNNRCKELYSMIFKSIQHAKMYYEQYKSDWKTCKELVEYLRNEMRCAVCDAEASRYFSSESKSVFVQRGQINSIIKQCYDSDLYEVELLREVYLAYLNYAKQVQPSLSMNHSILFSIFSNNYKPCAEWIEMTRANLDSD